MPMSPVAQIGGVTEHPVTAPRDDVRGPGNDIEGASGAQIRLAGLLGRNRLHVPESVSANLAPTPAREQVTEITDLIVIASLWSAASCSIAARHGFSLKRRQPT